VILDLGGLAALEQTPRTPTSVLRPPSFGNAMHMDIAFGPDV